MKYLIVPVTVIISLLFFSCKTSKPNDSVLIADSTNAVRAAKGLVDEKAAAFLVAAADARMMDMAEGKQAIQKGTTSDIKDYGRLMVKDQSALLKEIRKLAAGKKIALPPVISEQKEDGLKELAEKQGKDFDEKFIKMMKIDHERDVKEFTNAKELTDHDIKAFAASYLSMIQSHLDKINALKDK